MQALTRQYLLLLMALLLLGAIVYWPGLAGPFLFDDFANLTALGDYGGIRNWETFNLFVFGNHSGPTGRPIAMLSFLLNATNWPTNPWPFKFTNLMIHLGNSLLLFFLTFSLLRMNSHPKNSIFWIAFLTTAFWLLHPFNVSTVLYPVQRMAMLATLFTFAGLLGYLHGRSMLSINHVAAYLWMSLSLILGTLLATFSKENGALLPILAFCLEITVLRKNRPTPDKRWVIVFLWMPLILIAAYFMYGLLSGNIQSSYSRRTFSMLERVLTQPRILLDYLHYWLIPHIASPGLLTQDFPISKSLFDPATTLPSILFIISALFSALWLRKKFPYYSLAILFYFTGHIIESTLIPLEMYFEHRNYLPAAFLLLPITTGLAKHLETKPLRITITILVIVIPAFLTSARANIWTSEESLAYHWAEIHPESQRAMRHAALVAEKNGKYALALEFIEKARGSLAEKVAVELHWFTLNCRVRPMRVEEKQETLRKMRDSYFSFRSYKLISSTIEFIASGHCMDVDIKFAHQLIEALRTNTTAQNSAGARFQLYMIEGNLYLLKKDYTKAIELFRRSLNEYRHADAAMIQVGLLASAGQYQLALEHINHVERILKSERKLGELDYKAELFRLKNIIEADLNNEK